jgi:hypothetical protein
MNRTWIDWAALVLLVVMLALIAMSFISSEAKQTMDMSKYKKITVWKEFPNGSQVMWQALELGNIVIEIEEIDRQTYEFFTREATE